MTTNNSRSGLAVDLAATNRWLGEGETVKETDTGKVKIGPGLWNDLDYETTGSGASVTTSTQVPHGSETNWEFSQDVAPGAALIALSQGPDYDGGGVFHYDPVGNSGEPGIVIDVNGLFYWDFTLNVPAVASGVLQSATRIATIGGNEINPGLSWDGWSWQKRPFVAGGEVREHYGTARLAVGDVLSLWVSHTGPSSVTFNGYGFLGLAHLITVAPE